jgi:hypothetical protein
VFRSFPDFIHFNPDPWPKPKNPPLGIFWLAFILQAERLTFQKLGPAKLIRIFLIRKRKLLVGKNSILRTKHLKFR